MTTHFPPDRDQSLPNMPPTSGVPVAHGHWHSTTPQVGLGAYGGSHYSTPCAHQTGCVCDLCLPRAVQGHLPMMMWTRIESFVRKTITVDLQDRQTDRRTERDRGINKTTYDRHNINYWQFVRIASSTTLPYPTLPSWWWGCTDTHTHSVGTPD